jgi:hypothetical protein
VAAGDYGAYYFPLGRSAQLWQNEFAFRLDREALRGLDDRHVSVVDEQVDPPRRDSSFATEAEHVLQRGWLPGAEKFAHQLAMPFPPAGSTWRSRMSETPTLRRRASDVRAAPSALARFQRRFDVDECDLRLVAAYSYNGSEESG